MIGHPMHRDAVRFEFEPFGARRPYPYLIAGTCKSMRHQLGVIGDAAAFGRILTGYKVPRRHLLKAFTDAF